MLGTILLDWRRDHPGEPLWLPGFDPASPSELPNAPPKPADAPLLEQLLGLLAAPGSTAEPLALTVLGNRDEALDPYVGLDVDRLVQQPQAGRLATALVALLGSGAMHEVSRWPARGVLLSAAAVDLLARADTTSENALVRLREAGGRLVLSDRLYWHDPAVPLGRQRELRPHEERRPPAWGDLVERLDAWLRGAPELQPGADGESGARLLAELERALTAPAGSLHVTHSWGGGVARWVESFIDADPSGAHFQLRAEGPETGAGCGQRLTLYLRNRLHTPIASWWLQPPIHSSTERHGACRDILQRISTRHGIGRVILSSLVGHSLDTLRTGLPTLQVLHDYFPRWPLLGVNPAPYLQEGAAVDLERALAEQQPLPEFRDRDATAWAALGTRWRETVAAAGVRVVAPTRSVRDLLQRLDPAWSAIRVETIEHGLPPLPGSAEVLPRDREDGRLRLVVPGRIQEGKGQHLLLQALPELTRHARVLLLGAGPSGMAFFGRHGVDVILHYRRDELRDLLAHFGPHAAALLSIVPETYSYTLSEMQHLGIPVIATRVGSLAERIEDGRTGWLIEPTAAALVERVAALASDRSALQLLRERLRSVQPPTAAAMVAAYDALCPARSRAEAGPPEGAQPGAAEQSAAWAFQARELAAAKRQLEQAREELLAEVDKRTDWAQREQEQRERDTRVLERQRDARFAELQEARAAFRRQEAEHERTVGSLNAMLGQLQEVHGQVLASRSWRWTRPFRVAGRIGSNFRRAGALDPRRWPLLASQTLRTLRTRGLRGALLRAQATQPEFAPRSVDPSAVGAIGDLAVPHRFARPERPEVSIVIPVHGKWAYTAACLRSLAEVPTSLAFEVIVVDDLSPDDTAERLAGIEGLVVLNNEQNLGFVGSCNRGAGEARGHYLLFLNNDTQVLEGWLEALQDTFDAHPRCGMAGARLVYPDGRLQEAGGIIFRDGSGWNYGRFDAPERPEYNYAREVDYCSGACVMLPAELFRELGGFDAHYAPAYYEDTDLAFRVRAHGLQVWLAPAATVVHHEGITSGTDLGSGIKRHQVVNREKFLQRWQEQLQEFPAPVVDPDDSAEVRRARDHRLRGRVLIVDAYTPEPDQDSGSMRLRYLMDCFAQLGYGVSFLPDNRAHAGRYTAQLQAAGVEALYGPWLGSLQGFFAERGEEFDFVMISRHYVASRYLGLLRRYCPKARFLFDTVDLHYLREERLARLEGSLALERAAAQTRRSELAVIEAADATLVVSPVEKTVLQEAAPGARVHVLSNVHEVIGSRRAFAERKDLFFVGGYQHPPNIDAAQWFVGNVWPLIRQQLPDVTFHLIGSKAPEQVRALDGNGVCFHGYVEDLEPWLDGCRLAVAPLRYGAGIKGKVNMSMSYGQPVVATAVAVEGMFAEPGRDVLVADSAEDFAAAVVRLYRDEALWERISVGGLENVRRYFSVETARRGLKELLESL